MAEVKSQRIVFGETVVELFDQNPNVIVLDGDLANSTRADIVAWNRPDAFFQMGIAEQNLAGVAAGMASCGFIPFISTFAAFSAKRSLDQIRLVIAQPGLHVIVTGGYSGLQTGKTGKTHQAVEDISIFRAMPNMAVVVPADADETRKAMIALVNDWSGPAYIRLTRDPYKDHFDGNYEFKLGKAVSLRDGTDIGLIGTGEESLRCLEAATLLAAEGIEAAVLHIPTIKPLDEKAIQNLARQCGCLVTAEDHSIIGGLGSAVAEVVCEDFPVPVKRVGMRDVYGESAPNQPLLEKYGLTPHHIAEAARQLFRKKEAARV